MEAQFDQLKYKLWKSQSLEALSQDYERSRTTDPSKSHNEAFILFLIINTNACPVYQPSKHYLPLNKLEKTRINIIIFKIHVFNICI